METKIGKAFEELTNQEMGAKQVNEKSQVVTLPFSITLNCPIPTVSISA